MAYVLVAVIGYLVGCSNMAIYISRHKKVDIRAVGAGNPGTANTVLTLGWGPGILVGLHDISKGVIVSLIAKLLFPQYAGIAVVAGSACVIGHIYPVFMKFRGGKGFAAYIGMWLVVDWRATLLVLAVVVLVTLIFDYLTIGTTITVLVLPVYLSVFFIGWLPLLAASVATVIVILNHIENYVRIYKGTEFGLSTAIKKEQRVK
ncbi:MAG: glycerol-3-phosphate acyltransferase [Ruminococcaceae bacterium]|nr:glycerol-3-phosphate acyltransferase [Oscillospiraceae bacterium]